MSQEHRMWKRYYVWNEKETEQLLRVMKGKEYKSKTWQRWVEKPANDIFTLATFFRNVALCSANCNGNRATAGKTGGEHKDSVLVRPWWMEGRAAGARKLDAGHGWREDSECTAGGGARRRFMDVVGKNTKLAGGRKKKKKRETKGRKSTEAEDWLRPHLKGTAGRKRDENCSSSLSGLRAKLHESVNYKTSDNCSRFVFVTNYRPSVWMNLPMDWRHEIYETLYLYCANSKNLTKCAIYKRTSCLRI